MSAVQVRSPERHAAGRAGAVMRVRERPFGRRGDTWETIAADAGSLAAFVRAPLSGGVYRVGQRLQQQSS